MRKYIFLLILLTWVSNIISQDLDSYILRSSANLKTGNFVKVKSLCEEALSLGEDYRLLLMLAEAQYEMGSGEEAIATYKRANTLAPGSGELGLALIYANRQDPDKAVQHLERHLISKYKRAETELLLDESFIAIQSSNEWKELWKRSWYTELEKGISEAIYLDENGRLDELEKLESHLLPLYGEEPGMMYLRAIANAAGNNIEKALEYFNKAELSGYRTRDFYDKYINTLLENNKYFEAAGVCENARNEYPDRSNYLILLAEAHRGSGDRDRAASEVKLYLDLFPDNEDGLTLAGKIMNELRNYSDALKYFSRSVELYPGNPDHYISRGDVYSRTKTWQYAISDYSMALDLQPGDADVYYRKGIALLKTGKRDDACRDLRMSLKYGNKKAASEINKNCIR